MKTIPVELVKITNTGTEVVRRGVMDEKRAEGWICGADGVIRVTERVQHGAGGIWEHVKWEAA